MASEQRTTLLVQYFRATALLAIPATGENGYYQLDHMVSLAAPLDEGDLLLVGEDRLSRFDLISGNSERFCDFEADNPITRSNDARTDRHGSLWLSSMGKAAEKGAGSL